MYQVVSEFRSAVGASCVNQILGGKPVGTWILPVTTEAEVRSEYRGRFNESKDIRFFWRYYNEPQLEGISNGSINSTLKEYSVSTGRKQRDRYPDLKTAQGRLQDLKMIPRM